MATKNREKNADLVEAREQIIAQNLQILKDRRAKAAGTLYCYHGTYVGGCGIDWMCHHCEMGYSLREEAEWAADDLIRTAMDWAELTKLLTEQRGGNFVYRAANVRDNLVAAAREMDANNSDRPGWNTAKGYAAIAVFSS